MTTLGPVLAGCTISITAQRRADELAGALERRGATVHHAPTLGVVSHIDETSLLERTREIIDDPVDTVVVTTGIGFRGWLDTAEAAGLGQALVAALGSSRLIARGPKARGALQAAGLQADWVAESETAAEIADLLSAEGVEGLRIAIQQHGAGDDGLEKILTAGGAVAVPLVIYRWGPPPDPAAVDASVQAVARGAYDAVLFTSAPGAAAWLDAIDRLGVGPGVHQHVGDGTTTLAAVGPVTAAPLRDRGLDPLVPDRGRMGALVRSVILELGDLRAGTSTQAGHLLLRADAATLDHEVLPVSPSGLAVLRLLDSRPGQVFTREQLLAVLPGDSTDPHTAEVAVGRLRDAAGGCPLVQTVVKRGYRLAVSGEEEA